jgi:two-component system cell cycle sensor histidine kinase/response regulator CckA
MSDLPEGKNRRVLVIDDNPAIHDDFRKILCPSTATSTALDAAEAALFGGATGAVEQIQFEVGSAHQGQEGVLLVQQALEAGRPYAMAFVDVRMPPGWDGVETTRRLWEADADLQVVLCTAYSDYSWGEMFEKLGRRDGLLILKKPFDGVEAFQLAHALTEKWRLQRQSRRKMEELESRVAGRTRELAQSLSLLNATFESTADGVVAVDLSGKIVSYNTRFADTWQFPAGLLDRRDAAETRAHTAAQVKDPAKFLQRIEELKADPEAESFEVIELKDGRTFERYVFAQRVDGECVGTVINWRDITERVRAEEALQQSQERFRLLVEASPDAIGIHQAGKLVFINPSGIRQLGARTPEELLGRKSEQIIHPDDLADANDRIRRLLAGETGMYPAEVRYLRLDGTTVPVEVSAAPVIHDGQPAMQFVARDITERKRAEAALLESKRFLRSTLNALSSHIAILDAQGTIIEVNAAWNRFAAGNDFIGSDRGVGDNYLLLCDSAVGQFSEEAPAVARGIRAVMAGQSDDFQLEYPCHSAREQRWFVVRVTRFGGDGPVRVVAAHENITQRKRAEAELNWKTAFLEAQVNSSIDGILVVDQQGKKILQNQRLVDLFKIPPAIADESADADQVRWVTDMTRNPEQFVEKVRQLYAHPEVISRDEIELKDGTFLDRYSAPVTGRDGKYYGRIWTFRDITDRKRAEETLRESEERFAGAFEHAPIGVALVSPDGHWLKVNQALCEVVGYSAAELLTRTFQDITHPDDLAGDLENVRRLLAGEIGSYQIEKRYFHARGHPVTVLLNVSLVRDGQGRPRYFIAQIQDITERKRAENALRESNEKFLQLVENLTDAFWVRSPDMREVHYISPGFERIWGRSVESLYAHPERWPDYILPEDRERVLGTFAKFAGDSPRLDLEYRIVRPDGGVRWVHLRASQVRDAAGKLIRLTGIVSDITERKLVEAQLFQSQKLETVGRLAGGVAHEFNSILTAIIGQSELLLDDLPAGSPLAGSATEISKAAGRAATLTRQLLAYGRKQFLQPETLELNRVIAGMEGMLRHLLGSEVDLRIIPAPDLHAVKADAGQLEQVIMNLAINARDAMPNGGRLTLETANVSFDEHSVGRDAELKPGDYVMLAITDTGAGMSAEVKARLFEPFFTTKDVGQGTGLGLSTCYGILKQSGGHISVYSELARGTTFKIYLPQVEPQVKPPVQRLDSPDLPRGTETILLVEDDPSLREMAATLMRRLGYTVLTAANGLEALSLKQQRGIGYIDLLFTDVVMPHMSGKELADRVRAASPRTRVLFTSAYTGNAIVHQGVLNPGVALLQKPFTPGALARKIRETLDQPEVPEPGPAPGTSAA